jgi:hypothetical protein
LPPGNFQEGRDVTIINDDEFEELPKREAAWQVLDKVTAYRKTLIECGYRPVPCSGKEPVVRKWQHMRPTPTFCDEWAINFPNCLNTGIINDDAPCVDVDVYDEEVCDEILGLLETDIEQSAVRVGRAPKKAVPFRTNGDPFESMEIKFTSPNGTLHGVEVRCDRHQTIVDGPHPEGGRYRWHGGEIGPKLRRDDLPVMTKEKAQRFLSDAAEIMRRHGWTEFQDKKKKTNGAD